MTAYAPDGLFGLLTPQANTTAEPEFQAICPPRMVALTARMTSGRSSMDDRLKEYVERLDETVGRFANAPLGCVALACTGMSYIVDPGDERRILDRIAGRQGYPVLTAAGAILDALALLGARRVGVLSPYGDRLHAQGMAFWHARGVEIAGEERLASDSGAFHPIYAMGGDAAADGVARLGTQGMDAVLILGTGLPTLGAVLAAAARPVPILTPNLALMWRVSVALRGGVPERAGLDPWLTGAEWGVRFRQRMGSDGAS